MSADPNKKSARTFQCRDVLWETFEQMARELECSIDYLINESMKQYARQRSYSPRTPFPPPARVDGPTGSAAQASAQAHPGMPPHNATPQPPGPAASGSPPPPFGAGGAPMAAPAAGGVVYGASAGAPAYGAASPPFGVPPVAAPIPTPVPAITPVPPGQVRPGAPPPPPPPPGSSTAGGKRPSLPVPPPIPGRVGGPPPPPPSAARLGAPPPLPSQVSSPGARPSLSGAAASRSGPPPPPLGNPLSHAPGYGPPAPPMAPPGYVVPPQPPAGIPGAPAMGVGMPNQAPAGPALAAFYAGQRFVVNKDRFIIGRGKQSSDLTIKDPNVSRQHAMVEFLNGQYYMVDMGSTNGVEYNGQRIARKAIVEGDLFRICDHEVRFSYR
ncbi:FHA domain-containing protein [Sorangium sp. So ce1036]|uniref:FHA domain-containing protein n=1 Tax=Sorangium sp. So ce1036 TaxID=3133328 RepID=UPI003F07DDD5